MLIDSKVLVLNKLFQPVHITTARRAFCLLAKETARVVDGTNRLYSFVEWLTLAPEGDDDAVRTPSRLVRLPRVLLLNSYDRLPRREVKFSRRNVHLRDGDRCQYCGRQLPPSQLNLDHVIPVSRGGESTWENVVSSCLRCNTRKRNRSPEQAGLKLRRTPKRPRWHAFVGEVWPVHESWKPFLPV